MAPKTGAKVVRRRADGSSKTNKTANPVAPRNFEFCGIKEKCQSCQFVNDPYTKNLNEKFYKGVELLKEEELLSSAKVVGVTSSPKQLAYRTHAKLAVRADSTSESGLAIGLYQPGTHTAVDLSYCPIHTRAIGKLIRSLHKRIPEVGLTPYNEQTGEGTLRYITLRNAHLTDELMLTFVVTKDAKEELKRLTKILRLDEHILTSVHMNINESTGNAIYGEQTVRLAGTDKLRESICGLKFEVSPTAFFQVNPWQATNLYRRVEQIAGYTENAVAWDLYCGSGPISMLLASSGYNVVGIEENPFAVEDGKVNVRRNGLENKVSFVTGRVEDKQLDIPEWSKSPSLIVCNPSRRGIAEQTRDHLKSVLAQDKPIFVYVSCELETMARDIKDLIKSGHKLRQVEAFDMFAQTDKLEWIAVLTK